MEHVSGERKIIEKEDFNKPNILSLLFPLYYKKGMCAGEA